MNTERVLEVIQEIRSGRMVIVVDDESRENEGDFVMAAEKVTPEAINFMAKHGRGLICLTVTKAKAKQLNLTPMIHPNTSKLGCQFTVSVDAVRNTSTGSSAFDRCQTVRTILDDSAQPEDLARPGHVFPIIAAENGVLERPGHTEAALDLSQLAGFKPVGLLCEILGEDGNMAGGKELRAMSDRFGLHIVSVAEIAAYRIKCDQAVNRISSVTFPTRIGQFELHLYKSRLDGRSHLVLEKGNVKGKENVLVRVHSQCLTGDVFGSLRCDCGDQIASALQVIEREGTGLFVYLSQEGRGIGLANKIKAYQLQDAGKDTVEANLELGFAADMREYGTAAKIILDLAPKSIRLITNNPQKVSGLRDYGVNVLKRVPTDVKPTPQNLGYLRTKIEKMGHLIDPINLNIIQGL